MNKFYKFTTTQYTATPEVFNANFVNSAAID